VTLPIERRTRFRLEDFSLIGNIVDDPGGIWVRADSDIRDMAGLLAAARARPGAIGYGTTGVGSDDHLAMLALERKSGASLLHVPFAGSAQVKQNLLSRAIPVAVMNVAEGVAEMRQGVLRPLAQMGAARWPVLAEVPTLRELGFDVVEGSMRGMAAPAACRRRCWRASPSRCGGRSRIRSSRRPQRSRTCRCASSRRPNTWRSCRHCGPTTRRSGTSIPGARTETAPAAGLSCPLAG
jgi:hypothetical protein